MDEYRICSVVDLLARLKQCEPYRMFRGQACAEWPLLPAMGRMHRVLGRYEGWHAVEVDLLERFQKYARPFLAKEPVNRLEWLVIAQHYGLPTRLLDWTTNPLKALFFAVENPCNSDHGVLWALEPLAWWNHMSASEQHLDETDKLVAYFPDHVNQRVSNQESCFTLFPFPADASPILSLDNPDRYDEHIGRLAKFIVPVDYKKDVRLELQKLGVTHRSMFPGLDGLAKSIRREMELDW